MNVKIDRDRNGKNKKRVAAGKLTVYKRNDYQKAGGLEKAVITTRKEPHSLKMSRYRDRLLSLIAGKIVVVK